jgi:hypothetical protein
VSTDEITYVNGREVDLVSEVLKKDETLEKIIYSVLLGNVCCESQTAARVFNQVMQPVCRFCEI